MNKNSSSVPGKQKCAPANVLGNDGRAQSTRARVTPAEGSVWCQATAPRGCMAGGSLASLGARWQQLPALRGGIKYMCFPEASAVGGKMWGSMTFHLALRGASDYLQVF